MLLLECLVSSHNTNKSDDTVFTYIVVIQWRRVVKFKMQCLLLMVIQSDCYLRLVTWYHVS